MHKAVWMIMLCGTVLAGDQETAIRESADWLVNYYSVAVPPGEDRYYGRRLVVDGFAGPVTRGEDGRRYCDLRRFSARTTAVRCFLAAPGDAEATAGPDGMVEVTGTCLGYDPENDVVVLTDCVLQSAAQP